MKTHSHTKSKTFLYSVSIPYFLQCSLFCTLEENVHLGLNPWNENICSILTHHFDVYLFVNYIPNIFKVEVVGVWWYFLSLVFILSFYFTTIIFTQKSMLFSHSVVSNSLWRHGLKHARLPCPPLSPRVCPSSFPLSRWCYLTISSSAALFSFCLQSFLASGYIYSYTHAKA